MDQSEKNAPVCGMKVDPSKAVASVEHQGATVYFCSQGCAAKFRAAPEKYTQAKPDAASAHPGVKTATKREYTCTMHPEVKQTGPGSCPKCGMALEPVTVSTPSKRLDDKGGEADVPLDQVQVGDRLRVQAKKFPLMGLFLKATALSMNR